MVPSVYKQLIIKYILLAIIVYALLDLMKLAVDYKSPSWSRLKQIREHYVVYSRFSWADIKQMLPVGLRKDLRGTPGCRQKPADIIMIGIPKCGSGSVRYSLGEHPDVAMDLNSEGVQYFSTRFERGKLWYVSQMPCSEHGQLTAENSVQYFINEDAPARIATSNPNVRLILTVRDPIERLVSEFVQMQVGRPQYVAEESLEDNVFDKMTGEVLMNSLVSKSMYSVHLKRWLQHFDRNQIHVVNGDSYVNDPVSELRGVEAFLGVPAYFDYNQFAFVEERGFFCFQRKEFVECLESGKGRKHPDVHPDTVRKLKQYFRPYNEEFFELVGRDFLWND